MASRKDAADERGLWERLPVALYRTDAGGLLSDVNPAFLECFRAPARSALIGTRAEDLYADAADYHRVRWSALVEPRSVVRAVDARMRRRDGTTFWARETLQAQRPPGGDAAVYEAWVEDIDTLRHAEERLKASELRYRRLFETAKDGILILDADTAEIVDANPFLCDLLGLRHDEVIGRKLWEIGPFQDTPASKVSFRELQEKAYVRYEDLPLETVSGERIAVEFVSNVYRVGEEKVIQCNIRDITERRRLQQQLAQAHKMEAVGRLAGGVAHDFNNLLGIIVGYGEIVHRQLPEEDPLRTRVARILSAAERAADLTKQLLAFGRKQVLEPRILDLNAAVSAMEPMLRRLVGEDVDLECRLAAGLGRVKADAAQIQQALVNLVANARDAVAEGGRITIETAHAELDLEGAAAQGPAPPGPYVRLTVTDSGAGMDAATQARVFEPFFTTKETGKGTGLGLSTVQGIVEQSGGHVAVESELGVGTRFRIDLPRVGEEHPGPRVEAIAEPVPAPRRGAEAVLLVEDEASLRELLREALDGHGYSVLVARDGVEAVQIAEAHPGPIEIMVTDVILPGMAGPKAVQLVAQARPKMKVLYISGYSDEAAAEPGLAGPGRRLLSKPFGPETLLRHVRESLDARA